MRENNNVYTLNFKKFKKDQRAKTSKIATIVHDIRSPLQTLSIINQGHMDDNPQLRDEVTQKCINRMNSILNIKEKTKTEFEVCIPNLIKEIKQEKEIELNIKIKIYQQLEKAWIKSTLNAQEIKTILSNLINNASDALCNDITINIKQRTDSFTISIIDNGSGICGSKMVNLGQQGRSYKKNGNGIGLNQAIEDITSAGGSISCRSIPQLGTQISLSLPL